MTTPGGLEARIMALWDDNVPVEAIARQLAPVSLKKVRQVVSLQHVGPKAGEPTATDNRRACQMLAEAIARHHPNRITAA